MAHLDDGHCFGAFCSSDYNCLNCLQVEELQEKILRTYADMENVRERAARQSDISKKYAVQVSPLVSRLSSHLYRGQVYWENTQKWQLLVPPHTVFVEHAPHTHMVS